MKEGASRKMSPKIDPHPRLDATKRKKGDVQHTPHTHIVQGPIFCWRYGGQRIWIVHQERLWF